MLMNLKKYMDMHRIAIDSDLHKDLITEMRIATADEHLSLEKTKEQTYDLLDSFRLAVALSSK
jgi:uncharacterized protein (UPF0276 family)